MTWIWHIKSGLIYSTFYEQYSRICQYFVEVLTITLKKMNKKERRDIVFWNRFILFAFTGFDYISL
ncbi:hypothetical protein ERICIV_00616 [Paenibacillus larvae subsp. larvae]|uniref:Uncharacterized protein n=1 Tax=Paenibacillus larvae subsp. larvae TaxID=147375 RepID=A0A2L1TVX1_9BACL|nr:hypothetical protein ERICIII_00617 [Paenibacillus larvae subsp. larvae]AVF29597.1 hypothetical protein ERICIV_00616 [Paenibacillus larvae subsp. larvae]